MTFDRLEAIASALAAETHVAVHAVAVRTVEIPYSQRVSANETEQHGTLVWGGVIRLDVAVRQLPNGSWRMCVGTHAADRAVAVYSIGLVGWPSITVAANRTPQAIARDIVRRLLPDARAALAAAGATSADHAAREAARDALLDRAAAALRAAGWSTRPGAGGAPGAGCLYANAPEGDNDRCEVSAVSGGTMTIKLHVSRKRSLVVLRALALAARRDAP